MNRVALTLLTVSSLSWHLFAQVFSGATEYPSGMARSASDQNTRAHAALALPPTIATFSPTSGPVGTTVTITGTNFNTIAVNNIVYFGAVRAPVAAASSTSLIVTVPIGTTYARLTVTDTTTHLTANSVLPFVVTFPSTRTIDATSFASGVGFTTGPGPSGLALGDLDGDGKLDLVVANGGGGNNTISVLRNSSTSGSITGSSFAPKIDFTTGGTYPIGVVIGDIDGDGKQDIIVVNNSGNSVSVFRNTSTPGTVSLAARVDFPTGPGPARVACGDLDGDGKPDLAVTCIDGGNAVGNIVSVLRNTSSPGSASFAARVDLTTAGSDPQGIAITDVDGDGKSDLVVAIVHSNAIAIFRNVGNTGSITTGSFAPEADFATTLFPLDVVIGDIDGDGKPDVAVTNASGPGNPNSNTVTVLRNTSTPGIVSLAPKIDFLTGQFPYGLAIADLDGDGRPDLSVTSIYDTVSVLKNISSSGKILFAPRIDYRIATQPGYVGAGDMDGDGKPEVIVLTNNTALVFRNTVSTAGVVLPTVSTSAASSITSTTATLNGTVNPNGVATTTWFEWGTSTTLATYSATPTQSIGKGSSSVSISAALTGLVLGSTYNYRAVGQDSAGTVRGNIVSFKTSAPLPTVITNPPTNISATSATLSCIANANGDSTNVWFEWGTDPNMTTFNTTPAQSIGSGTSISTVTAKIVTNPNTSYLYRAVAQNSSGAVKGSIFNFTSAVFFTGEYISDAATVLLFHFDETSGSTVSDASSYGNNGTATGTTIADGRFGKARYFNGSSDIVNVSDNNVFNFGAAPFTIETWVKFNAPPSRMALLANDEGATVVYPKWIFWYENGAIKFHVNNLAFGLVDLVAVPWTPIVGKWYHLAVLHYGSTFDLYMDGLRAATQTSTIAIPTINANLTIGSAEGTAFLNGMIDEVRITNKARSPQEFNLQLPPTNVSASVSGTTVSLSWQKGGGAIGLMRFRIYRGTDSTNIALIDSTAAVQDADAGLTSGKTYFYRISAVDSTGFESARSYSAVAAVGVPNSTPTVTTSAATNPGLNTATLNGSVNPNGLQTNVWFEWGTSSSLATSSATSSVSAGSGNGQVPVSAGISGLTSGTTYYYRLVGQNSAGKSTGSILSFTTTAVPSVTTQSATSITSASATVGGTVNPNGIASSAWFEWGLSSTLASYSSTSAISLGSGTGATPVSANLTGLSLNTTYYFRIAAQNSAGTQRGSIFSFTTTAQLPISATRTANILKPGSALLSGTVNPNGLTTTASFEWGTSSNLSTSSSVGSQQIGAGTADALVAFQVDQLAPNTTYYFRVVGQNSAGTSKGSIASFLSTPGQPSLTSPSNASLNQPASVLLSWNSVAGAASYHVQLSTNPTLGIPLLLSDSLVNSSSRVVSSLALSSGYSWRVRARNSSGYGDWSAIYTFSTVTTKTITSPGISYPANPMQSTDYRLVSFPGTSLPNFGQILTGTQSADWRIFEENGGTVPNNVNEISSQSTPNAGQGYWLLTKGAFYFSRSVTMPQIGADGTTPVSVRNSWNIIGNPFDVPVNWATVQADNQTTSNLWSYEGTGGFRTSTTLDPFKGYYFFNGGSNTLRIRYPFPTLEVVPEIPPAVAWRLQLSLETEQGVDRENYIGIAAPDAKNLDALNQPKPPALFDQNGLCLKKPAQDGKVESMSGDFRNEIGDGQVWDFEITNPRLIQGKIGVAGLESVPPMYSVFLIDEHNSVPLDLRRHAQVEFRRSSVHMRFHLIVGRGEFVQEQVSKFVPKVFELCQNYPNPFNPSTAITYLVPRQAFVKIEIISLLGQYVQTLAEGNHPAGIYTVVWSASGPRLTPASSGIYFARLLVDGKVMQTKKMTLLK